SSTPRLRLSVHDALPIFGLARLGRRAELAAWFGQDERGDLLRAHLEDSGVQIVPGSDHAERTSTAKAYLAGDGAATYTFDLTSRDRKSTRLNTSHVSISY